MSSKNIRLLIALPLMLVATLSLGQLAAPPTEAELTTRRATQLNNEQLQALLKNQTLYHANLATGQTLALFYREDGRRFVKVGSSVRNTKWWIKDSMRCEESVARPGSFCQKHFQDGEVLRACFEGEQTCNWIITVSSGDPEGIGK